MTLFDQVVSNNPAYANNFIGYIGNPPTNAEEYQALNCWADLATAPSWVDVVSMMSEIPLQDCKKQASALLYETDWTTISDVANSANTPYLTNQAAFIAWRNQIRALVVNPVLNPVFPPKPDAVWG
jgi:hypothetical protein